MMRNTFLLAFAGLLLAIALTIAWVLAVTLFFPHGQLAGLIVDRNSLIRSHIDYLMMAQFIFLFALLFRQYSIIPPWWVMGASCYGAFFNPLGFLKWALFAKPPADAAPIEPHFSLPGAVTFTCTTVGFLAAVVLIIRAAWRSSKAGSEASASQARADASAI